MPSASKRAAPRPHRPSLAFRAAGATDAGRVRPQNEDAFTIGSDLLVVSDGVGGAQAGATASKLVVDALPRAWSAAVSSTPRRPSRRLLCDTITELSQQIHNQAAHRPELAGMGATVVAVALRSRTATVAHMGDSRAYLLRAGELRRLTADHSVVALLLQRGEIGEEEANVHPARHTLSRFVGMPGSIQPDVATVQCKRGDKLLLCTDGLTDMLADYDIAQVLESAAGPEAACTELVSRANDAGGRDNITVVVAAVGA